MLSYNGNRKQRFSDHQDKRTCEMDFYFFIFLFLNGFQSSRINYFIVHNDLNFSYKFYTSFDKFSKSISVKLSRNLLSYIIPNATRYTPRDFVSWDWRQRSTQIYCMHPIENS